MPAVVNTLNVVTCVDETHPTQGAVIGTTLSTNKYTTITGNVHTTEDRVTIIAATVATAVTVVFLAIGLILLSTCKYFRRSKPSGTANNDVSLPITNMTTRGNSA